MTRVPVGGQPSLLRRYQLRSSASSRRKGHQHLPRGVGLQALHLLVQPLELALLRTRGKNKRMLSNPNNCGISKPSRHRRRRV